MQSTAKENILRKIKKALEIPVPLPFPELNAINTIYPFPSDDLKTIFTTVFTSLLGKLQWFEHEENMVQQFLLMAEAQGWKEIYCAEPQLRDIFITYGFSSFSEKNIADVDVSITSCEALVARTGTILLSSKLPEGRTASVYAPVHVCVAFTHQMVYDNSDAILMMQNKYPTQLPSMLCFATGPSRTADIEKTLVVGVHGPKEVFCLIIDK
ncbi:MAG: LUD domain-containing protein [Chitinophagaceae bacterium]|nr:LUD domain-containing protein [Chitinophagaceae bacterium]